MIVEPFLVSLSAELSVCLRYPYEAIHVITSDGYVLLLERLPRYDGFICILYPWSSDNFVLSRWCLMTVLRCCRRDSWKAVYLQHGILDSSMG